MGGLGFDSDVTGSIPAKGVSPLGHEFDVEDWRRAKGAMAIALDPTGGGAPVTWDNPDSGLKGTFTPLGSAYVKNGDICRSFRAAFTSGGEARSVQAVGCRVSGPEWAITDVKPWRKA